MNINIQIKKVDKYEDSMLLLLIDEKMILNMPSKAQILSCIKM